METLQIVNGSFIRRPRKKYTVLCDSCFRILILNLAQAGLKGLKAAPQHENGRKQRKCMATQYSRLQVSGRVEIKGLPLKGKNKTSGSAGNTLRGIMGLLRQSDPFV
jgi:hypothetical protein